MIRLLFIINLLSTISGRSSEPKAAVAVPARQTQSLYDYVIYDKTNQNRISFDSTKKYRSQITKRGYCETTTIYYKQISVTLKSTFIKDSVLYNGDNSFNPICTSQTILFKRNDKIIKVFASPAFHIYRLNSNKVKFKMLENVIMDMGLVKGKNRIYCIINGSGGPDCPDCSFLQSVFDMEGKLLSYEYGNKIKMFKKLNDYYNILRENHISKSEVEQQRYSRVKTYSFMWWIG